MIMTLTGSNNVSLCAMVNNNDFCSTTQLNVRLLPNKPLGVRNVVTTLERKVRLGELLH